MSIRVSEPLGPSTVPANDIVTAMRLGDAAPSVDPGFWLTCNNKKWQGEVVSIVCGPEQQGDVRLAEAVCSVVNSSNIK